MVFNHQFAKGGEFSLPLGPRANRCKRASGGSTGSAGLTTIGHALIIQMNCRRGLTVELMCREGAVEQSARKTCNTPVIE